MSSKAHNSYESDHMSRTREMWEGRGQETALLYVMSNICWSTFLLTGCRHDLVAIPTPQFAKISPPTPTNQLSVMSKFEGLAAAKSQARRRTSNHVAASQATWPKWLLHGMLHAASQVRPIFPRLTATPARTSHESCLANETFASFDRLGNWSNYVLME